MSQRNEWSPLDYDSYELEKTSHRLDFIRKVYSILSVQLLITTIFVLISVCSESYRDFMEENLWFYIVCILLSVIILLVLFFVKELHRKVPYNYILLFLFTIFESFSISYITSYYSPETIALATGCTAGLTLILTLYAYFTKSDFTMFAGSMIALSFGLLLFGLIFIIIGDSNLYRLLFCPLAVICYGIFLVYDTQLIIGTKRHKIGYDDYILGSVALYIDIVGLFVYLLQIIGKK